MPRPKRVHSDANHRQRVTLQDIAKVAGLNVMTVSNALRDAPIVALATRERVKRIAAELNYVPNSAAKALVTGRTGLVAIMCGPLDEPYYATAVRLLGRRLNAEGYRVLLTSTETHNIIDAVGNTAIDGAIAIDRHDLIEQFQAYSPVPCVSIGTYERSFIDNVVVDLSAGVGEAVRRMIKSGRQRIAYLVTTYHMAQPSEVRAAAYFHALQDAGLASEIINVNSNFFDEVEANLRAYFAEHGAPDALLCQNDETAMLAYRVLRDTGHRIPEDVLLVGCDGQLHMKYFAPPLSTIAQPLAEMCDTAWKFLKNRMNEPDLPVQHAVFQGQLVVRESLGVHE